MYFFFTLQELLFSDSVMGFLLGLMLFLILDYAARMVPYILTISFLRSFFCAKLLSHYFLFVWGKHFHIMLSNFECQ